MNLSEVKSIGQKTLVPLGVALAATGLGWWWRDRESTHDAEMTVRFTDEMREQIARSTEKILSRIDSISERYSMLDKAQTERLNEDFLALYELNATLTRPHRYK